MRTMRLIVMSVVLLFLMSGLALAADQQPKDYVSQRMDAFAKLLKDPAYKNPATEKEHEKKIWDLIYETFDFIAVSQRALGHNWKKFNPEQRKNFSGAFAELLSVTYLNKIRENYNDEKFDVTEQELMRDGKRAQVKCEIKRAAGQPVKLSYMLYLSSKGWRVYDVNVEGISLVKNYRAQFAKLLLKESPDTLIDRVKEKVDKLKKDQKEKKKS